MTTPGGSAWGPQNFEPQAAGPQYDPTPQYDPSAQGFAPPPQGYGPPSGQVPQVPPSPKPAKSRGGAIPVALTLVLGLVIGGGIGWAVFGMGDDSTEAATAPTATIIPDEPPSAPIPASGKSDEKAEDAKGLPARPGAKPVRDGKTGPVGGPRYGAQDKLTTITLSELPFSFDVPEDWKCRSAEGQWYTVSCATADVKNVIAIGVKKCAGPCGADGRAAVRAVVPIKADQWRETDSTTYYSSLSGVLPIWDNKQGARMSMAHFFPSQAGGAVDTGVVAMSTGLVAQYLPMQQILNEIRLRAAG